MGRTELALIREEMKKRGIDAYLVPTADFHGSEYVGDYFKVRAWISGFTGSAGTVVVTEEKAGLWTDGRYFVQAASQLEGSGIDLYRMGEEGVPDVETFLAETLQEGQKLAFDGRVMDISFARRLRERLEQKGVSVLPKEDLAETVWKDRPSLSRKPAWFLDTAYAGESRKEKLERLRRAMEKEGANIHLLTALDDIAWLFNIRGGDVHCNPVVLAYGAVEKEQAFLFVQDGVFTKEMEEELKKDRIFLRPYGEFYQYVSAMDKADCVWYDPEKCNYQVYETLPAGIRKVEKTSPVMAFKAVKNETEMEHIRIAHRKDGVAMTRFVYWFKKNVGKIPMTEISVSDHLLSLRQEQEGFLDLSFDTISAYGEHGAMCHYSATPESDKEIQPKGFYLVDSGGQYLDGTTDITRTIAAGPLTEEEKLHYTLVLKGMIRLAGARFLHGCRGLNLDYLARGPLWQYGLDYNHGTGHGVGYLLNVHEPPNGFRWKIVPERNDSAVLEEGMLTSDEPGYYEEGSHGIRTENLLLCRKGEKTSYGQFMWFEPVTLCPIDTEGIDLSLMDEEELQWLNEYHKKVFKIISPYLEKEEAQWLKEVTAPLSKA